MNSVEKQRLVAVLLSITIVITIGVLVRMMPAPDLALPAREELQWLDPQQDPEGHGLQAREAEIRNRFNQAVTMLHARQYEYAITALERVLKLSPDMPEAHVNMGYALLGLEQYEYAEKFFSRASLLKSEQVNAYYGWALALEGMEELEGALGAIETYLHLAERDDPYRAKAKGLRVRLKSQLRGGATPELVDGTEKNDENP